MTSGGVAVALCGLAVAHKKATPRSGAARGVECVVWVRCA